MQMALYSKDKNTVKSLKFRFECMFHLLVKKGIRLIR